ncbi:MAG: ATP-binding protein [Bacteroides sp.]|nr:ATP-binding protein [Bacteroides sp.]
MITRQLQQIIEPQIGNKKAIIIMGARQVGKSTLLRQMLAERSDVMWLNGDDIDVRQLFSEMTASRMKLILGSNKILVIDEAQRIPEIGLRMKVIIDQIPDVQILASGSSSFQLASQVSETLTGRKREYQMFPLSFVEMVNHTDLLTEQRLIPHRLIYGYYPEVVTSPGEEREVLRELSSSYLYRDILQIDGINKPEKLQNLLQALARQIGDQISYREIGQLVGLDSKTVERYIDILEKSFIVFRLGSFARNLRNELKQSKKIYFYDLGIRNAVISDFRLAETREDIGALWENFVIVERLKQINYSRDFSNLRFWRSTQQHEIDLIEESDGQLRAIEIKWNPKKANAKLPNSFASAYPDAEFRVITPQNLPEFLL